MYVRALDKASGDYFKSIVYATLDEGWYMRYIVFNPQRNAYQLIRYLDGDPHRPLIEQIQPDRAGWAEYGAAHLLQYRQFRTKEMPLDSLRGYPEICENAALLCALLEQGQALLSPDIPQPKPLPDENKWRYIRTQADADAFMELFSGFHDALLTRAVYEEGFVSSATVTFDNSGWYGVVECCFEGVRAINLRPPKENMSPWLMDAALIVQDETIFWADAWMESPNFDCDGTWIHALSMKWRKIG